MLIEVDFDSDEAIYIQLCNQIIMGIATSVIREGDSLPSVRQLADMIGVNMHTVNKAYSVLKREGYISLDKRRGAVIALDIDKLEQLEDFMGLQDGGERLVCVGDGINDAPVLARADVGIAMGALGSAAAIEAADIVLMDDDPMKISKAIRISRKCLRIVYENIWFAIGIKLICLVLEAVGIANMWLAIFADVGVMIIAVLNAIRALFVKKL